MKKSKSQIHYSRNILFISALNLWSMGKDKGRLILWRPLTGYIN